MANGKRGDHPFTDMAAYGEHPFPRDIERKIRKLWSVGETLRHLDAQALEWDSGQNLDEAHATLDALLRKNGIDPKSLDADLR